RQLADAGADALELNVYGVAADPTVSGADIEHALLDLLDDVRATVTVPLAIKIGPFHSSLAHFARELEAHGADGIVLFNRFVQPDIDLDRLAVVRGVRLSTASELLLPLRWTALLRPHVRASLALTTGVQEWADAVKAILAGADVAMTASAVLRHGPAHLASFVAGVERWLDERGYDSVRQARGSLSSANVADASAYERAQYVETLLHTTPID
ncbi:MAG TPA: dihydroorotate dehydrogenase, partial [Acidimicrobiia bacterium]|nr:dihydroorotate dehydrogenase [Acidimicrobiia bacterium]